MPLIIGNQRKYGGIEASDVKRLKELGDENVKLKKKSALKIIP